MSALAAYIARLFPSGRYLCLLGFCAPQIWIYLIVQQMPFEASIGFHCASGVVLLIAAAILYLKPQIKIPRSLNWISVVCMCAFPIYLLLFPENEVFDIALCIIGGLGCGWCFLIWFKICFNTGTKNSICYLLFSFMLAALCRLILALLPTLAVYIILVIMSLSLLFIEPAANHLSQEIKERNSSKSAATHQPSHNNHRLFILIELALYSFVLGAITDSSSESQALTLAMVLNYSLRIVFMFLFFAWFALRDQRRGITHVSQGIICCIAALLLALVLLGGETSFAVATLISFSRGIVLVLLTIVAAEFAHARNLHPFVAFGVARAVYEFAVMGGSLFSMLFLQDALLVTMSLNVMFFIVGCFVLVIANRTLSAIEIIDDTNLSTDETSDDINACYKLARTYNLTERETEVFVLLCQGHGKAYIADKLGISENTVRHHSKNIYTKAGVHSREELMDLQTHVTL